MLAESIDRAMEGHHYRLAAFVFMPEHVDLLIFPLPQADTIDALSKAIKRPFSYRVKQLLIRSRRQLWERLTICWQFPAYLLTFAQRMNRGRPTGARKMGQVS